MSGGRSSWEPRRWSDGASDAPAQVRFALDEARRLELDPLRLARLAERVGVESSLAAGAGLSSIAPPGGVAAYKLWAYLSGVVAISSFSLMWWNPVGALAELTADPVADVPQSAQQLPEQSEALAPTAASSATAADTRAPLVEPESNAVLEEVAVPMSMPARTSRKRVLHPLPQPAPAALATEATLVIAPPPPRLDPQAELAILSRAQDALRQAPTRALRLAQEHASTFPNGVFAQEREVIAIEALIELQRSEAATERGREFLAVFPSSTHAPRVREMLRE